MVTCLLGLIFYLLPSWPLSLSLVQLTPFISWLLGPLFPLDKQVSYILPSSPPPHFLLSDGFPFISCPLFLTYLQPFFVSLGQLVPLIIPYPFHISCTAGYTFLTQLIVLPFYLLPCWLIFYMYLLPSWPHFLPLHPWFLQIRWAFVSVWSHL